MRRPGLVSTQNHFRVILPLCRENFRQGRGVVFETGFGSSGFFFHKPTACGGGSRLYAVALAFSFPLFGSLELAKNAFDLGIKPQGCGFKWR